MPLTHRELTDPRSQAATAIMKAPPAVIISSSPPKTHTKKKPAVAADVTKQNVNT